MANREETKECNVCMEDSPAVSKYCSCVFHLCTECVQKIYDNTPERFCCPGCRQELTPEQCGIKVIEIDYESDTENTLTNIRDAFPEEMTHRVVHVEEAIPFPEF